MKFLLLTFVLLAFGGSSKMRKKSERASTPIDTEPEKPPKPEKINETQAVEPEEPRSQNNRPVEQNGNLRPPIDAPKSSTERADNLLTQDQGLQEPKPEEITKPPLPAKPNDTTDHAQLTGTVTRTQVDDPAGADAQTVAYLDDLPHEVLMKIPNFTPLRDLMMFSEVNGVLHKQLEENEVLKKERILRKRRPEAAKLEEDLIKAQQDKREANRRYWSPGWDVFCQDEAREDSDRAGEQIRLIFKQLCELCEEFGFRTLLLGRNYLMMRIRDDGNLE